MRGRGPATFDTMRRSFANPALVAPFLAAVLATAAGCGGAEPQEDAADGAIADAAPVADGSEDAVPVVMCPDGLRARGTVMAHDGPAPAAPFDGPAHDFALMAFRGPITLEALGGGCSPIVIFIHIPGANDGLFETSAAALAQSSSWNTHYLFVSDAVDAAERERVVTAAADAVDRALRARIPDTASRQASFERFHFGLTRASEVDGSLGAHVRAWYAAAADPALGFEDLGERGRIPLPAPSVVGIDPALEWDPGGSLSPWVGASPELGMGAWLGEWLGWRAEAESLEPEGLVRHALHDATTTARHLVLEVPPLSFAPGDRAAIEIEVEVRCEAIHPLACSEWDRLARVSVCTTDAPGCDARVEIGRWITPYWRRGRQLYRMPVRHAAPLLTAPDARLHVELGPEWERPTPWHVEVAIQRMDGPEPLPAAAELLMTGGSFDADFGREVVFPTRTGMDRAELWVVVTGHGQTEGDNCAEWCDHRHRFEVNGKDVLAVAHGPTPIGHVTGCAERAHLGVMPLQWGNWAPQRAYWCPGEVVAWHRADLDGVLAPAGLDNRVRLSATLGETGAPAGGDIALTALIVWYE